MKRMTIVLLMVCVSMATFGQVKKNAPPPTKHEARGEGITDSTWLLKGKFLKDTLKISVLLYADDGTVIWKRAYQVVENFYPIGWQAPVPFSLFIYDDKFSQLKPEEVRSIIDKKAFDWK